MQLVLRISAFWHDEKIVLLKTVFSLFSILQALLQPRNAMKANYSSSEQRKE